MKDIYGALHPSRETARVTIKNEDGSETHIDMHADSLTNVIKSLARIRAAMADTFPRNPQQEGGIVFEDLTIQPGFIIGKQVPWSQEFYFAVRHDGYGWMAFTFNMDDGAKMIGGIATCCKDMAPSILKPPPNLKV